MNTTTPPPRYDEPLDLYLVRGPHGARAFSNREAAEISAQHGERIYRGPRVLGDLLRVCQLVELTTTTETAGETARKDQSK